MPLPKEFQFSQASLQDFVDCPRRFQLRYLLKLRWPAVEAEPIEEHERRMELGRAFHQMVQQHVAGVPEELIGRTATDPDLRAWWRNYLVYRPIISSVGEVAGAAVRSEVSLMSRIAGYRVMAKYDVLITRPDGGVVILDWKTTELRPSEQVLRRRLQSRVYPLLAVQAGGRLYGEASLAPSDVEMVYWFPKYPGSPMRLPYGDSQYEEDLTYLTRLIERIATLEDEAFYLTEDEARCRYCPYRSYCERGVEAGALADVTAALELEEQMRDLDLDFEQVAEIEF